MLGITGQDLSGRLGKKPGLRRSRIALHIRRSSFAGPPYGGPFFMLLLFRKDEWCGVTAGR